MTLIVLLILASVSLSGLFSEKGLFKRTENASSRYNEAKAREVLETVLLADAQYEKNINPLYNQNDYLDELIKNEIDGAEVLDDIVIVDGYIYELDRTVPKIGRYLGLADGVIITAKISGNEGWLKPGEEANIKVTGKIMTYSGGNITTVLATKDDVVIPGFSIDRDGRYTIDNIASDAIIVISAEDSKGKESSRTIPIKIKIDNIPPVLDSLNANTEGMKIVISATGHDNETGLKHFKYVINSVETATIGGISEDKKEGTFLQGEILEIITTKEGRYNVSVFAVDNSDNISTERTEEVITEMVMTIAEAREKVDENNLKEYLGTRISDYNPKAGGTWRIFYYDKEGKYGYPNELYFKCDPVQSDKPPEHKEHTSSDNGNLMKCMNPLWGQSTYAESIDIEGEKMSSWLCDPLEWKDFSMDGVADFAIASPSAEMLIDSCSYYSEGSFGCYFDYGSYKISGKMVATNKFDSGDRHIKNGPHGLYYAGRRYSLTSFSTMNGYSILILVEGDASGWNTTRYTGYANFVCPIAGINKYKLPT